MAAADHDAVLAEFAGDLGRRTRHRHECDRRGTRLCIAWPEQAYLVARGEKVEDRLHALRFAGVQERAHARCTAAALTAAMMAMQRVEVIGDAEQRRNLPRARSGLHVTLTVQDREYVNS